MPELDVVARARALVGVRFRPQGRDAATGLDCVGLVAAACELGAGRVRSDYRLRYADANGIEAGLRDAGLHEVRPAEPGDVLLVRAGWEQLHLAVLMPGGFVHADAGMWRVVEVPGSVPWPVISCWRMGES